MSLASLCRAGLVAALLTLLASTNPTRADFIPLGALPSGIAQPSSLAFGVSAGGGVVVGRSSTTGPTQAFRWTAAAGMAQLGDLPAGAVFSSADHVSADGSTVVGSFSLDSSGSILQAFRWTQATGIIGLGYLPGGSRSLATATSADGSIVVGADRRSSGLEAFRWTASTGMIGLGHLPGGNNSSALDLSADGSVIVGQANSPSGFQAARWTAETGWLGLGDFPGGIFLSGASGVSADGSVVVGFGITALGEEAFRWTAETGMIGLGLLPGAAASFANGVSGDGSNIVGLSFINATTTDAFIWDSVNGMRRLQDVLIEQGDDLTGWRLTQAYGISPDGQYIVGSATNPRGNTEAFLARLTGPAVIPEPGSLTLLGLGALGLVGYYWRRRILKTRTTPQ